MHTYGTLSEGPTGIHPHVVMLTFINEETLFDTIVNLPGGV